VIKTTLEKFYKSDVDSLDNFELYILKDKRKVLYIGISKRGIWNRWFDPRGHMPKNIYGDFYYGSSVGRKVITSFPKSWKWTIELWTRKDCLEFLKIDETDSVRFVISINYCESAMIAILKPKLNARF